MSQFNDEMNKKAVALSYDEESNAAPVIVASGSGYLAQKIVETARSNGIPIYEDNSLATVLSQMELGSEIPEQLYQAIVDIYVYFLNFGGKKGKINPAAGEASTDTAASTVSTASTVSAASSAAPAATSTASSASVASTAPAATTASDDGAQQGFSQNAPQNIPLQNIPSEAQ